MPELNDPVTSYIPGVLVCAAIAAVSFWLGLQPFVKETLHLGALLIVIVIGMGIRSLIKLPDSLNPGIALAQRPILRWAVAGLGFKLSLTELVKIGPVAILVVIVTTTLALLAGEWLGKLLKVDAKLSRLLSTGTAICGASAIVATDSVVQSEKSQVACSLGLITLLGTLGILIYPPIGHALNLSSEVFSIWNGASLHEMAQVVAAGQSYLPGASELSTTVKLARITLLAPFVFYFAFQLRKQGQKSEAKVPLVPWFLVVFLVIVAFNSIVTIPKDTLKLIQDIDLFLLCLGMAGVGLKSGLQDIKSEGVRPVVLATLQWAFLAAITLGAALLAQPYLAK